MEREGRNSKERKNRKGGMEVKMRTVTEDSLGRGEEKRKEEEEKREDVCFGLLKERREERRGEGERKGKRGKRKGGEEETEEGRKKGR